MEKSLTLNNMTRQQKIDKWTQRIDCMVEQHKALTEATQAAIDAGCMDIHGPLYTAIWKAFTACLDILDKDGWINWWIYERPNGRAAVRVHGEVKRRYIDTKDQLAALMADLFD
jgi:hypothetical protein